VGVKAFVKGFAYAFRGVGLATSGRNMRFHLVAAAGVVAAGVYFGITSTEWLLVVLCVAAVISAEIANTAIEEMCNLVDDVAELGINPAIRNIKDLAAGAVLITSIGAAVVGLVIFIPHIF